MTRTESEAPDAVTQQANQIIDNVISSAYRELSSSYGFGENVHDPKPEDEDVEQEAAKSSKPEDQHTPEIKNIEWMTYEQFTPELAIQKINEFVETWDYEPSWKYCTDFIEEVSREFDFRYRFQVRWSVPTRRKPIPRATARVFFTIVVSKVRPPTETVDVYYVFETNRLVHRPGTSRFRQKWLSDIIENQCFVLEGVNY